MNCPRSANTSHTIHNNGRWIPTIQTTHRRGGPPCPPWSGTIEQWATTWTRATTGGCPYGRATTGGCPYGRATTGGCPYGGGVVIAGCGESIQNHDHKTVYRWGETKRLACIPWQIMATQLLRTGDSQRR